MICEAQSWFASQSVARLSAFPLPPHGPLLRRRLRSACLSGGNPMGKSLPVSSDWVWRPIRFCEAMPDSASVVAQTIIRIAVWLNLCDGIILIIPAVHNRVQKLKIETLYNVKWSVPWFPKISYKSWRDWMWLSFISKLDHISEASLPSLLDLGTLLISCKAKQRIARDRCFRLNKEIAKNDGPDLEGPVVKPDELWHWINPPDIPPRN